MITLLLMIWLHIIDDFYLQGILAKMKQRSWWEEQPEYSPLYKYDYIVSLLIHAFSWSFAVHLPWMFQVYFSTNESFTLVCVSIGMHWIVHAYIDHLKCNIKIINLVVDQLIHLIQLVIILNCMMSC